MAMTNAQAALQAAATMSLDPGVRAASAAEITNLAKTFTIWLDEQDRNNG